MASSPSAAAATAAMDAIMIKKCGFAIVLQNPKPGSGAATPRVDVLISQGPKETSYVMPHLVGLNEVEAQHRLDQAQMRRKVNYVGAPQWPHGSVIDQAPLAGAKVAASATIELTIAN